MESNEKQRAENQTSSTQPQSEPITPQLADKDNNLLMGVLCYLGPLVIIPYMTTKDQPFVKYHIKQGVVLVAAEVIIYIIGSMITLGIFIPIAMILNLGALVLTIIGIVNVLQKKESPLPLLGQFADKVKI